MTPETIAKFLKLLGVQNPQKGVRTGWVVSRCPLGPWRHEHGQSGPDVFGVKHGKGKTLCKCFSCGWGGTPAALLFEVLYLNRKHPHFHLPYNEAQALLEESEASGDLQLDSPDIEECLFGERKGFHEMPEWWLDTFNRALGVPWAVQHLHKRGVLKQTIEDLDIRADTQQMRLCFPVRDFSGRLGGLHGRAVADNVEPRYRMYLQAGKKNPDLWLGENTVDLDKPVVFCEGPFDLAAIWPVYHNVVSPLFVTPSQTKLHRMSDAAEIITFYDRGNGGDAGRKRVSQHFGKTHVVTHITPPEGRKDPGEMAAEEIADCLNKVQSMSLNYCQPPA